MMNPIRRILLQYISKGLTETKELASLMDCSVRKVQYFLEGEGDLKADQVRVVCQHFSHMGRNELSSLFIAPSYQLSKRGEMKVNGSLYDELADTIEAVNDMVHNYDNDRPAEALEAIDKARLVLERAAAEVKLRKGA